MGTVATSNFFPTTITTTTIPITTTTTTTTTISTATSPTRPRRGVSSPTVEAPMAWDGKATVRNELNIQLGDFTLKTSRLQTLPKKIKTHKDLVTVLGSHKGAIQCAVVKQTTERSWYRLVGSRHDVLLWKPDLR